jgi:archaellin
MRRTDSSSIGYRRPGLGGIFPIENQQELQAQGIWGNIITGTKESWARPDDWITFPTIVDTDQIFAGSYAVFSYDTNYVTLAAAGAYHVDWGDGTSENVASGITVQHNLVYAGVPSGSWCSRGYRQALIVVTPQAGQTLSSINLGTPTSLTNTRFSKWLSCKMALNNAGTLATFSAVWSHSILEEFIWIGTNAQTDFTNLFANFYSLQSVSINTEHGINFTQMFWYCYSLVVAPFLDTSSGINFTSMFATCYCLQTVPLYNTSAAQIFTTMFQGCWNLIIVPLLNTANVSAFGSMFNNCYSLQTVPSFDTSHGVIFTSMFTNCYSLQKAPLLNTSLGNTFQNFLTSCFSLETVPLYDTGNSTNFAAMFQQCYSLKRVPLFNTSKGTNFSNMFNSCYTLQTVPLFNLSSGTLFTSMFTSCYSLYAIPSFNMLSATGTAFTSMFSSCWSLTSAPIQVTRNISISNSILGAAALNNLFTALGNTTGQIVTITNNPGSAGCTRTIATAKGWTVSG